VIWKTWIGLLPYIEHLSIMLFSAQAGKHIGGPQITPAPSRSEIDAGAGGATLRRFWQNNFEFLE
jgi:hypothetical protein